MQEDPQITELLHEVYINIVKQESRHVDKTFPGEGDGTALLGIDFDSRAASPPPDVIQMSLHTKVYFGVFAWSYMHMSSAYSAKSDPIDLGISEVYRLYNNRDKSDP